MLKRVTRKIGGILGSAFLLMAVSCGIHAPAAAQVNYLDRFSGSVLASFGKAPVDAATTANITLSGYQTVDGISLNADYMRVLVKNQTDATQNGIYTVFSGQWIRSSDFAGPSGTVSGQLVHVSGGSQAGIWSLTTPNPVQIDQSGGQSTPASNITFSPFVASSGALYNAGMSSGTNTITASTSATFSNYTVGQVFEIVITNTNTGSATLNISSHGAKTIKKKSLAGLATLAANDLIAGQAYMFTYDGTQFQVSGSNLDAAAAPLNSPIFTGTPSLPTGTIAVTQSPGDNSTKIATTAYADAALSGSVKAVRRQIFTTSGTYTPCLGLVSEIVEELGGGGGGGSTNASSGATAGGGGAGEYGISWFQASDIGSSQSITIGAGGTGGTSGSAGNAGGDSIFGTVTAHGGLGGSAAGATDSEGGLGGAGGNAHLSIPGAPGGIGFVLTGSGFGGAGASTKFGAGGKSRGSNTSPGYAASGYGAGGGGTVVATGATGGAGSPGIVVITEFCSQ